LECYYAIPAKYRKAVFTIEVEKELKEICLEIEKRYPAACCG